MAQASLVECWSARRLGRPSFSKSNTFPRGKSFRRPCLDCPADKPIGFPYLLLLVSGGHSQILIVKDVGSYKLLGTTLDDAVGEAFDKIAKLLGIDMPGGPNLEKLALRGDPEKYRFPRPLLGRPDCNFSLSGLKTAVRYKINQLRIFLHRIKRIFRRHFRRLFVTS